MEMQQAWDDVQRLLNEVRPHLLRAGIPDRQLVMPLSPAGEIRVERYVEIFDWLHEFMLSDEWSVLMKAWKLRPEHIWANYELHEIKGLQEQILLEKAQVGIRKRWKLNRPFFFGRQFKKGKPDGDSDSSSNESPQGETSSEQGGDSESPSGGSVRSEGDRAASRDRGHRQRHVPHREGGRVSPGGPNAGSTGKGQDRVAKRHRVNRPGASE
jgi:hypothetical protein